MRRWRETAHLHETTHEGENAICHDCRRGLISDAGTERILVCPKLHGRRPAELLPSKPNGAAECGQPES